MSWKTIGGEMSEITAVETSLLGQKMHLLTLNYADLVYI